MSFLPGLLLGLSIGTTCLAYCAPTLFPYLLGNGQGWRQGAVATVEFLAGRLLGYIIFALAAWGTNQMLFKDLQCRGILYGSSYLALAGTMILFSFQKDPGRCAAEVFQQGKARRFWGKLCTFPVGMGLLTGMNLCPPFLLAFARAAESGSLWGSLLFFATFFIGTSVYFIPAPFFGSLGRFPALRQIGRWTALIIGVYYIYLGVITVIGGILS